MSASFYIGAAVPVIGMIIYLFSISRREVSERLNKIKKEVDMSLVYVEPRRELHYWQEAPKARGWIREMADKNHERLIQ